jgi:hypothetical protein
MLNVATDAIPLVANPASHNAIQHYLWEPLRSTELEEFYEKHNRRLTDKNI